MQFRKGFKNVNISNGLFFFERCSLINAMVCAKKFPYLLPCVVRFVCTHRRSYMTTLLNCMFGQKLKNQWKYL